MLGVLGDSQVFSLGRDSTEFVAGHGLESRATAARPRGLLAEMAATRWYFGRLSTYGDFLFMSERLNGVKPCGLDGRKKAEKYADRASKAKGKADGPEGDIRFFEHGIHT